ncbi:hypothetical protein CFC21_084638 [Triticum aestivum]|uniref:Uncharacterized protein n=3 Tax=Triticum TaxID=4564 RepID=A0A9R0W0Z2_TRITD|nr:hypothetical protein CFC21_084638 [Triticum aestivum]VAH94632.1 unnamed protein product [Triticum turgidum subsp. durum]
MAATMKLSLTFILLLSAVLVVFGDAQATCDLVRCKQGGHITCKNYPGQKLDGCACVCAPKDGKHCVLRLDDGSTYDCPKTKC